MTGDPTHVPPDEVDRLLAGRRIAIAHDYLTQRGGAERVVLSLLRAFPGAEVHTLVFHPEGTYPEFADVVVHTSEVNRVPFLRRDPRRALPLLARASDRLQVEADLVIASTSGWAHAFPTTGRRLVYCHSPARWLYLTDQYLGRRAAVGGRLLAPLLRRLRRWDQRRAHSAGPYLANSSVVRERIAAVYGIDAPVVAPPHQTALRQVVPQAEAVLADWSNGYHLCVSRLQPYKNLDHVLTAFAEMPDQRLVIVGRGPLRDRLRAKAPANVRMVEGLSDAELAWAYGHATALIAASHEDFGLTPLEAAAFGVPTLALQAGGYLDSIAEAVSGAFFDDPTADSIREAVLGNLDVVWHADAIREHAETFSEERFIAAIRARAAALFE